MNFQVLVTSLSLENIGFLEPANFWLGPAAVSLTYIVDNQEEFFAGVLYEKTCNSFSLTWYTWVLSMDLAWGGMIQSTDRYRMIETRFVSLQDFHLVGMGLVWGEKARCRVLLYNFLFCGTETKQHATKVNVQNKKK